LDASANDATMRLPMRSRSDTLCVALLTVVLFAAGPATAPSGAAPASPSPGQGADFARQARLLYRVATCGQGEALPSGVSAETFDAHCRMLAKSYAEFRAKWLDRAVPYLARLVPQNLPRAVVYPFGGGDLVTALATFPDAEEFTTISLEPPGDVRKVDALTPAEWQQVLAMTRATLGVLFAKAYNTSATLRTVRAPLPEEIVDTMAALVLFDYEPIALRYFTIERDGSLHYLDGDARVGFAGNMELVFRKTGDVNAAPKVLRHIAANLSDRHLRQDPRLLRHLEAKGSVVAMTKASIHLLASDDFSLLRAYLLAHMEWMISDDTGILPRHARAAGFVQEGHGIFNGPSRYGHVKPEDVNDLRKLFPHDEKLPFFAYGYPDASGHGHLIVTRKAH
jgi:hypothetical protein